MNDEKKNGKVSADPSNFRQMILEFPKQFRVGFELGKEVSLSGEFSSIEISGMGGSALPGNLLRVYLSDHYRRFNGKPPIAIYQNRSYGLPHEAYRPGCLNFLCSYSGNTEETVASFEEAIAHGLPSVGISAGGKIEALCEKHGVPHISLPIPFENFQPRVGTGYFFGAIFGVLVKLGMASDTCDALTLQAERLLEEMPGLEARGKELAEKVAGKTPVVYANPRYKSVAMIWKIKINENAKTPAFWNFFPELNHNEMVGFTKPQGEFLLFLLRDAEDHPQNLKRFEVTSQILGERGIASEIIDMGEGSVFTKIFRTILLGDWMSYHLALRYGVDPTPVDMVEELKKRLV
ncbi:MAG: bifunctional phosphoglucose/phosphomannose isomerase [Candidatus Moraniibacteriota bacterium]|nr:MAG: bifunctional phosphoglucose/phosphomannose isomerase [Candidatus Moranbacteria bacterium]